VEKLLPGGFTPQGEAAFADTGYRASIWGEKDRSQDASNHAERELRTDRKEKEVPTLPDKNPEKET